MSRHQHEYGVGLSWEGNRGTGTSSYTAYDRRFRLRVDGKPDLLGSADPAFRGERDRHNPEELLLAALSSCHMLFYLSLCARQGVVVTRYDDAAQAQLAVAANGSGEIAGVTLRPRVTVERGSDAGVARALHERAGELCFLARSCRFPILCEPEITVA